MSRRSSVEPLSVALGAAALLAAAQLGVGYGLNVVVWPASADSHRDVWPADLAWVLWLAAGSTVVGAVLADRLAGPVERSRAALVLRRTGTAVAAAVGAAVSVPLTAVPARAVPRPDTFAPEITTGGYAVLGVLVGLAVATAALVSRAIAANVLTTVGLLWLVAVASVAGTVDDVRDRNTALLAVWPTEATGPGPRTALFMLLSAVLVGVVAAWPAARRGDGRVGTAVSGAVGPALVAAAYLVALPGLPDRTAASWVFYLAPYAVIAGLAGSVLAASVAGRRADRATRPLPANDGDHIDPDGPHLVDPAPVMDDAVPPPVPEPAPPARGTATVVSDRTG